jgi:hypothetical protein
MTPHREDEFDRRPELVKKRARAYIWTRVAWTIVSIYILGSLALLGLNAISSFQTRDALLDCTQPTGDCSQENHKETANVIQQLIDANSLGDVATQQVVVLAASCAEEPVIKAEPDEAKRITLLQDCINEHLKKPKGGN